MIEAHKLFLKDLKKLKTIDRPKENVKKRFENTTWNNQRKVLCINTDKVYNSIREATRDTGCYASGIIDCCKGRIAHVKNLQWKYVEDDKSKKGIQLKKVMCIETGEVFRSAFECGKKFEIYPVSIIKACKDGNERKGYHFKFSS